MTTKAMTQREVTGVLRTMLRYASDATVRRVVMERLGPNKCELLVMDEVAENIRRIRAGGHAMTWTDKRPTVPGYYWIRDRRLGTRVVQVTSRQPVIWLGSEQDCDLEEIDGETEWAGPLECPA